MNHIDGSRLTDEPHDTQHQQYILSVVSSHIDTLSLRLDHMPDIVLDNLTNQYLNTNTTNIQYQYDLTSFTYKIILGIVCACLCFLTIMGNLLVLITFRRMRTVSITMILFYSCMLLVQNIARLSRTMD
jgi:small-conductance mechanosensitive channel